MKWPWVSRVLADGLRDRIFEMVRYTDALREDLSRCRMQISSLSEALSGLTKANQQLTDTLEGYKLSEDMHGRERGALMDLLTAKNVIITPTTPVAVERPTTPTPGRSGFRHMAQAASEKTYPKPSDSSRALDDKVRKEGGVT